MYIQYDPNGCKYASFFLFLTFLELILKSFCSLITLPILYVHLLTYFQSQHVIEYAKLLFRSNFLFKPVFALTSNRGIFPHPTPFSEQKTSPTSERVHSPIVSPYIQHHLIYILFKSGNDEKVSKGRVRLHLVMLSSIPGRASLQRSLLNQTNQGH